MGIFDRIFGRDDEQPPEDSVKSHIENPEESNILLDPDALEGKVHVSRRTEIIDTHYDDVTRAEAEFIAETLQEYMETYDLEKTEAKNRIEERTGLNRDRVTEILWTERSSVQKCDEIRGKQNMPLSFEWSVGNDPCSPICAEVEEATRGSEETFSVAELQGLLEKKAEKYADEGGTPERMEHWVPHHKCKATLRTSIATD